MYAYLYKYIKDLFIYINIKIDSVEIFSLITIYICLLTCSIFNIQYVGETALPLHKRINIHRTVKSGFEYGIKHFRNDYL